MHEHIIELLDQRRLKEALVQLQAFAVELEDWQLNADIESLSTTYNYMLQYAAQGVNDPERGKMYCHLWRRAYELADKANFIKTGKRGTGYFADTYRRQMQHPAHSLQELQMTLEMLSEDMALSQLPVTEPLQTDKKENPFIRHEQTVDELFYKIWTSAQWSENEQNQAEAFLSSLLIPANDIAVMLSATTLSLLHIFDSRKYQFLINAYQSGTDTLVTQRALVGIALVAYYQEARLNLYPELLAALSLLTEKPKAAKELLTIQILLLLSRETEKISKKMREEIIPQMMRSANIAKTDLKILDLEELEDKNPEWSKGMAQVENTIRELGELQMEGADTYMSTFSQLKSYPFFREAAHWFYPFDKQTPEIAPLFKDEKEGQRSMMGLIMDSPVFCNSDKYSFCLTLFNLPEQQRQYMTSQFNAQTEMQAEQIQALSETSKDFQKPEIVSRQYIHDLYRFFKLWMYRNEVDDIFKSKLNLWNCQALGPLLHHTEAIKHIADHLFAKDYMEEASQLYLRLSQEEKPNAEIMQKLGYTYQKMKNYEEAIRAYLQADLLKPDHLWTLKHLAQCYKRTRQYSKALEYYEKVKEMKPDDLNILLQIGQCLATLRRYKEALAYFFKVEYLDNAPANAQRAIGWCYFMTGKYEDALRFYRKLTDTPDNVPMADWLNTGHAYLALGKIPEALEHYRKAENSCISHEAFIQNFKNDKEALLEQGVPEDTLYLIPDML